MSERLIQLSSNPTLLDYCAGAAARFIRPVAQFLAPNVPVPVPTGFFKLWTEKVRFSLPDTAREVGGHATKIDIEASNSRYNCSPQSLDFPIDRATGGDLETLAKDGLDLVLDVANQVHELSVITKALSALVTSESLSWGPAADPIVDIDTRILKLIKQSKCGQIGVLFGASAWDWFKNHPKVVAKAKHDLSWENSPGLFHAQAKYLTAYSVRDLNADGLQEHIAFMLDGSVIIFARSDTPTRRDPSFMKTFRLSDNIFRGLYDNAERRITSVACDWTEDVQISNTVGAIRLDLQI